VPAEPAKRTAPPRERSAADPGAEPFRDRPAAVPDAAVGGAPVQAPPAGSIDLAGSLRDLLESVDTEVRAVSGLSEHIDELVGQLNQARDEQATRLLALDALRGSVQDDSLGAFLDKAIRPRRTRVDEVFPDRLGQG